MLNGLRFGPWELFIIPLGLILNTVVYIMRGLRLLILYNPDLRHRWGPYIKESFMLKTVVVCFAVIQAILRSLALMFGVPRCVLFDTGTRNSIIICLRVSPLRNEHRFVK